MALFHVKNEYDLGQAIWESSKGDTIILEEGKYGNLPIKSGVNYHFEDKASASEILGFGFGGDKWSASSFKIGDTLVKNPKIDKSNIRLHYIFRKKLPVNFRFDSPIFFVHANGAIIQVLGNDKDDFFLGGAEEADRMLPKAVVDIFVPCLEEFDFQKTKHEYLSTVLAKANSEEENEKFLRHYHLEIAKKDEIEKKSFNQRLGLGLNDFEYKALWAINGFLREYAKVTGSIKIKGYDIAGFKDGLLSTIVKDLTEEASFSTVQFINQFSNQKLTEEKLFMLSEALLSVEDLSISDYLEYQLHHLNYQFATIGMYQVFEVLWEGADPAVYNPDELRRNKWKFIEYYLSSQEITGNVKKHLGELINARNNITHSKKLMTFHSNKNKLKVNWGCEILNEYRIFALKVPWHWYRALKEFVKIYNSSI